MWLNVCNFFWMYGIFHALVHIHYILENFSTLPPCLLTVSYYTCTSAWNFPLSITILLTLVKTFFVTEKLIIILFQLYITGGWDSSWFWMGRESQRGKGTPDWMEKAEVSFVNLYLFQNLIHNAKLYVSYSSPVSFSIFCEKCKFFIQLQVTDCIRTLCVNGNLFMTQFEEHWCTLNMNTDWFPIWSTPRSLIAILPLERTFLLRFA